MTKGLPKWAIKKAQAAKAKNVFAYAWSLVKKTSGKAPKTLNPKKRLSNPVRKMAKKKHRRSSGMTIPIAPIAGLAAGMVEPAQNLMAGNFDQAFNILCRNYTGYVPRDKSWNIMNLTNGLLPLIAGLLVHKFVGGSPLNLNRTLARAKVPFVRL